MADISRGHTDTMMSRKRLSYTVGALYRLSGQLYGCPKSLQQRIDRVCCPPPVLYVYSSSLIMQWWI